MKPRALGWRDRVQIVNSAIFFLLSVALAVRGASAPSVPIFLMSGAFAAYAIYRFVWIWRFFRGGRA